MPRCINCQKDLPKESFSNKQLKNKAGPKCADCVSGKNPVMNNTAPAAAPPPQEQSKKPEAQTQATSAWGAKPLTATGAKPPTGPPTPNFVPAMKQPAEIKAKPTAQQIPQKSTKDSGAPLPPLPADKETPLPPPSSKEEVKQNPYRDLEIYSRKSSDPVRPNKAMKYSFKVQANMFSVDLTHICQFINHYDVSVTIPAAKGNPKIKDEIMEKIMNYVEKTLIPSFRITPPPLYVFDGKKNIYINARLPFDDDCFEADMDIKENNGKTTTYHLKITLVDGNIDMTHILQYPSRIRETPLLQYSILDNIFAYFNSKMYLKVGAKYFNAKDRTALCKGAELYNGFHQGVRMIQAGNAINIDVANTAFIEAVSIPIFLERILSDRRSNFSIRQYENRKGRCCLNPKQVKQLKSEICTYKVVCDHQGFPHEYRVMDVSPKSADEYTFELDGKNISVSQYFYNQYNIKLRYPTLPVILVGGRKIAIPAELCVIKENQKRKKKVSDEQQQIMVRETAKRPFDRKKIILRILQENERMYKELREKTGINVSTKFMECNAMLLDQPKIQYSNQTVDPNNGGWNQKGVKLLKPVELKSYAVINCDTDRRFNPEYSIKSFMDMGKSMGVRVPEGKPRIYNFDSYNQDYSEIIDLFDIIFKKEPVQIVFVYIPRRETEIYTYIKKASDIHKEIPSQVMVTKSVLKGGMQYSSNVWLKVNGKLGGINFNVLPRGGLKNPLQIVPTILLGADVTHPSPGTNMKSIAAVVCSTDLDGLRVASEWRCQESRVEIIQDLGEMVEKFLKNWIQKNPKVIPKRVLFYRDGVSISQRAIVQEQEIPEVSRAINKVFGDKADIKLTFLLVRKRHNVRFFCDDNRYVDRNGNIKSGAVIDNTVCNPEGYDWYCYSHGGLQGTSKPTLYDVLYDEVHWDPNDLYLTTYWQCFTFIRSTKAVSIPPMAYYAHLTAFRARYLTKKDNDDSRSARSGASGGEETDISVVMSSLMYNVMYYI